MQFGFSAGQCAAEQIQIEHCLRAAGLQAGLQVTQAEVQLRMKAPPAAIPLPAGATWQTLSAVPTDRLLDAARQITRQAGALQGTLSLPGYALLSASAHG